MPVEFTNEQTDILTEITFSPKPMSEFEVDTRALTDEVNEWNIYDLWVLQFKPDGSRIQVQQYFSSVHNGGDVYSVKARLEKQEGIICLVANTFSNTLFRDLTTLNSVAAIAKNLQAEDDLVSKDPNSGTKLLPMVGYYTGTPSSEMPLGEIKMEPIMAKVSVNLATDLGPNGASFTLTSVKVCNVPQKTYYYRDPLNRRPKNEEMTYPATSVGFIDEWADLTPSDKTLSTTPKLCGSCYLPENARGDVGNGQEFKDKNASTALGGAEGQGNYATYIDVKGVYSNPMKDRINVTYRIYLGPQGYDYNVLRGYHYIVNITIRGMDRTDTQIRIGEAQMGGCAIYDYTENLTGRFVYAQTNIATTLWAYAMLTCNKNTGWSLPSMKDLNIMFALRDTWDVKSNGFNDYNWTLWSDEWGSNNEKRRVKFMNDGSTAEAMHSDQFGARCVRQF